MFCLLRCRAILELDEVFPIMFFFFAHSDVLISIMFFFFAHSDVLICYFGVAVR